MENNVTKEQLIDMSISKLGSMKVPVILKDDIAEPVLSIIQYLLLVKQIMATEAKPAESEVKPESEAAVAEEVNEDGSAE